MWQLDNVAICEPLIITLTHILFLPLLLIANYSLLIEMWQFANC